MLYVQTARQERIVTHVKLRCKIKFLELQMHASQQFSDKSLQILFLRRFY